ncbi:MAG: bifunctional alpha,alpha-trehalose-phosphate synthase (UDP-forming)/trehalose-phosphatase [Nitrospirota bacterium]
MIGKENYTNKKKRILIVSNRLPVNIRRVDDKLTFTQSEGGVATGLSSYQKKEGVTWVGWPGYYPKDDKAEKSLKNTIRKRYNCEPIFLSRAEIEGYYNGFSNQTIWPLFHYFPEYSRFIHSEWLIYKEVNERFAKRIVGLSGQFDQVWIHDYHLMLLPMLLRNKFPDLSIGFFLHIPFPSFEIFRYLPWRKDIIEGLLGADLIGFHTFNYTLHFLISVSKILGIEHHIGKIKFDNRIISAETFPMGIDLPKFEAQAKSEVIQREAKKLLQKTGNCRLIISVDRLDYTKGIPNHLKAIDCFLSRNPEWHDKVIFIQICVPSRINVPVYKTLKLEVEQLVGAINGKFGTPSWLPIHYLYQSFPFSKLAAMYLASEVALITPLRDGMNLVSKEYLATHINDAGKLILSEEAGAASELTEAIIVNPHDISQIAEAINCALNQKISDTRKANEKMYPRLKKYDIFRWTEDFLTHLDQVEQYMNSFITRKLIGNARRACLKEYGNSSKRLLFFDYDGTLVKLARNFYDARPDKELISMIKELTADPSNIVVIISGRDRDTLDSWFYDTNAAMVAEHGSWVKEISYQEWKLCDTRLSDKWKNDFIPIFDKFMERTPGSTIEEKDFSLVWHYRKVETELGNLRANELTDILKNMVANTELQVLLGNKVVEIKPAIINKGRIAGNWISREDHWEFVFAVGDDITDEDIFKETSTLNKAWTIKVGLDHMTKANYLIDNVDKVRALITDFVNISRGDFLV